MSLGGEGNSGIASKHSQFRNTFAMRARSAAGSWTRCCPRKPAGVRGTDDEAPPPCARG